MPNLITKFTQSISEAFSGPRTKDVEYDNKIIELASIENALNKLRQAYKEYENLTKGFKNLNKQIKESIKIIYSNTHFAPLYEIIDDVRDSINHNYEKKIKNINNIISKSTEWLAGYENTKHIIDQRQNLRKIYDHYDEKIENLINKRKEKIIILMAYFERVSIFFNIRMKKNIKLQHKSM